jgi:methionyl-tRNA synthetase
MSRYFTTAINYPNGRPHLGHAFETCLTDVFANFFRLLGEEVFTSTGLDEHGEKIEMKAEEEKITPIELCDKNALFFQELNTRLNTSFDRYIRTTEEVHKRTALLVLRSLILTGMFTSATMSRTTAFVNVPT